MYPVGRGLGLMGVLALLAILPQGAIADTGGGIDGLPRLAFGRVEGQVACTRPGASCRSAAFTMSVLEPMRILEAACVDGRGRRSVPMKDDERAPSDERCADPVNQALWYRLEQQPRKSGWVPAKHVWVWESRHALIPSIGADPDVVPGYCDLGQAEQALKGEDAPCAALWRKGLWLEGGPMRLPVLDIRELGDGVELDRRIYLKVLAPIPCGATQGGPGGDSRSGLPQDRIPAVESLGPGEWDPTLGAPVQGPRVASCVLTDLERELGPARKPRDGRSMVVRELWVPAFHALMNVALLTHVEARELALGLQGLAMAIGEEGKCAGLDRERWREVLRTVPPAGPWTDATGAFDPAGSPGGRSLHDFWRLALSRGDSVVFQPFDEIKGASPDRCAAIRERLNRAGSAIEQRLSWHSKDPFTWISFIALP